ncbi:MAG: L-histidine N(alpha)-methyltransferase [Methyloceanibacter sp.]
MDSHLSLLLRDAEAASEPFPGLRRRKGEHEEFATAVLAGLARPPRSIPCRFFYDAQGCGLFEEITRLPEYYPTRTETALLEAHANEIAALVGMGRVLIEFGSGSSRKTSLLISALRNLVAYVPIDVSAESLQEAAGWLSLRHFGLNTEPVVADFTKPVTLPEFARTRPKLGFFSGSTIGNFTHDEAGDFLRGAARLLGKGSRFLIGVDLKKPENILVPAYDDARGVTAAFNLNLLERINRELGGDFDLSRFAHEAIYNEEAGRVEIYLKSLTGQRVRVLGREFRFARGERIHTENSHKYAVDEFQALAADSGWTPVKAWTDPAQLFSLHLLHL